MTAARLLLLGFLGGCDPSTCSGSRPMVINLTEEAPLQARYQEDPLTLQVTTTRLDTQRSAGDRIQLEWNGKGGWGLEHHGWDEATAPSIGCEALEAGNLYAHRVRFQLGTLQELWVEAEYPPLEVEVPSGADQTFELDLWDGLRLSGGLGLW
jgi:hypothetical protein